jgi:hypothetical protein
MPLITVSYLRFLTKVNLNDTKILSNFNKIIFYLILIQNQFSNKKELKEMKPKFSLLLIVFSLISCDKITHKTQNLLEKSKNKVANKLDNYFPTYDAAMPDTESNKKRFQEILKIEVSPDVKNIFAYSDFFGADYKVLLAFYCNKATFKQIIEKNNLQLSSEKSGGLIFEVEFPWWKKERFEKINPYKIGEEGKFWRYLWYDVATEIAYYEEFSL